MKDLREQDRSKWIGRLEIDPRFPMDTIIDQFDGTDNTFLSNFYPFKIRYCALDFMDTEHAYQWAKPIEGSVTENGELWSEKIRLAPTAAQTKKLARQCPIRPDWEQIKFMIMKEVLIKKFRHTPLWDKLDATGNAYLIEGTTWHDNCWGICIKKDCEKCRNKKGLNRLGLYLMELREILRGNLEFATNRQ